MNESITSLFNLYCDWLFKHHIWHDARASSLYPMGVFNWWYFTKYYFRHFTVLFLAKARCQKTHILN